MTISLNLSRKWRSQDFDHIIGQDLAVRILKNSLYVGHYFPVYLLAGQRGCGKTSTARVFAAALNCKELPAFQKDPKKSSIPCLICVSCKAMQEGKHPDFIEIDAASYTGVDHMRTIIESSSLLPIMGRKRVYLIDEAHMLSKAAFNAALKILEEPPATALFMLATTNPDKIIDTVRSRCFQLFFSPIAHNSLKNHLRTICSKESIAYDDEALDIIVRHTQGSARDALNVLEQVRFSSSLVSTQAVLTLLRYINDEHIIDIITIVLFGAGPDLLQKLTALSVEHYDAQSIWQRLVMALRALLWLKHGMKNVSFFSHQLLNDIALRCSLSDVQRIISALYEYEELFLKTPMQYALLEMILLNLCQQKKDTNRSGGDNSGPAPMSVSSAIAPQVDEAVVVEEDVADFKKEENADGSQDPWKRFVEYVIPLNDPLINSLFKQASFKGYNISTQRVTVEFAKDLILFKDWLDNARDTLRPVLKKAFGVDVEIEALFTGKQTTIVEKNRTTEEPAQVSHVKTRDAYPAQVTKDINTPSPATREQRFTGNGIYKKTNVFTQKVPEKVCDVSDENRWKMASMLLRHFPGVVTEIREKR